VGRNIPTSRGDLVNVNVTDDKSEDKVALKQGEKA
jgi:pyrimidine operon attenuation protein/uracil phosphoribosyltransferase